MIQIRQIAECDLDRVAEIHGLVFPRQIASSKWIKSNFNAFHRITIYLAVDSDESVLGYAQWIQKNGLRKEGVVELDQTNNHIARISGKKNWHSANTGVL